jgi:hypothetical protein
MVKASISRICVPWFDSYNKVNFFTNTHNSKIKFIFFSSEINQLEIINQSVLRMFIKPYNFVLFTSHTRDLENFSVVSVLAFILPTPGGGVVKVTKDHKKISCLMGPYNTVSWNHYIYNHDWRRRRML